MGRLGFIHEKLDIKILILYILRRLPGTVDPETLAELCQCDSGVGYFDYSDCLADLVDTGHITESERATVSPKRAPVMPTPWRAVCPIPCAPRPRSSLPRWRSGCAGPP